MTSKLRDMEQRGCIGLLDRKRVNSLLLNQASRLDFSIELMSCVLVYLITFFAYMTFESLSLKTNTVYYSCSFDFYIVNDQ